MSGEVDWLGGGAATATVPPTTTKPTRQQHKASIPFADAWLVFRANDDGRVEALRAVAGSHLNRLKPGEPRDWSHDIHLAAFAPEGQPVADIAARDAWQGFLKAWPIDRQHLAEAMRQAAQVVGLEYLAWTADRYEEAIKP